MIQETLSAAGLDGKAIRPGDAAYDEARSVWNGTVNKRPALIVRCRNTDDVVAAVKLARTEGLAVSVRGGGHHVAGSAVNDGGLVIDLSEMREVTVDAAAKTARAQGGALLVDVDNATLAHGLAVPMGLFSETGIAGLTLAGGYGWQSRLRGLTCDNLIAAEIVTADGSLLKASASENPDLFWALCGGGQNLGVVTSFEYRAHPIPDELFFLFAAYPMAQAQDVLTRVREYTRTAPREAGIIAVLWTFPGSEPYPEEIWDQQFVGIAGTYIGDADEGERVLQPLRELGTPMFDISGPMPFGDIQHFFDEDYPNGRRYYWRSTYLKELSDDALVKVVDLGSRRASPLTSLDIWIGADSAVADVAIDDTPIAHRHAPFMVGIESNWDDPADDAANIGWAREAFATLAPHSTGGSYLNFEDLTDKDRVAAAYGPNYERLMQIKRQYDPDNLFGSRR